MVNFFPKRSILIFLMTLMSLSFISCTGGKSTVNTTWSLVMLLSVGDPIENSSTEIVEVKNCGVPTVKTTSCSAGTSNDLNVSLTSGGAFGEGAQFIIEGNVGTTLGIGQESGESVTLPIPPSGYIYTYTVNKIYKIVTGQALARSSNGEQQPVNFNFHASCSIDIIDKSLTSCSDSSTPQTNISPTSISRPTTPSQQSGLGSFTFGQYDFDEANCILKDNTDKVNQLELWQNLWLGFAVPYQTSDVGKSIYWTVYSPNGTKMYDNEAVELGDSLCNRTLIEMGKNTPPGQYHLLVTYQNNIVFEKYFQVEYYDLSQVILPNRSNFGTGIKLGRTGAYRLDCKLAIETDSFNAADFLSDEWVYYIAPYKDSDVGKKYRYQVYDPNMVLLHNTEMTLPDEYQHCAWGGFSLGNNPEKGEYMFRILYNGEEIFKTNFWVK